MVHATPIVCKICVSQYIAKFEVVTKLHKYFFCTNLYVYDFSSS